MGTPALPSRNGADAACFFRRGGQRPISHLPVDLVITGLHLRWDGVWQRPNHLLARLARELPVLVVEEPVAADGDGETIVERDGVTVLTPRRAAAPADALDERTLGAVRRLAGERRPLIWLYTPMMLALADAFPGAPVVFDKMDELAKFAHADPRIRPREDAVLRRADVVFTGGRSLHRSVEGRSGNARCYPSGVDVEHFGRARTSAPHPALAAERGRPVFGYVGVIDERLDLDLVDRLAAARSDATIALVGPTAKIDEATLPRRDNIRYLGKRDYEDLPSLLAAFDVALMPFALNEHTENISPTKTLEYLAAGRPVVSTAIADVVADHADVVHVARDAEEFVRLVADAERLDEVRRERAAAKARAATWEAIAAAMRDDLAAAGIRYAASSPVPASPLRSSSFALP